jgi:uncharacterized membrane protein YeaQ/YmgE (transglycosylase-associated protein family)
MPPPDSGDMDFKPKEMAMHWIITLLIGGIVGWLASMVMKTNAQMGWIANVLIGVLGSMLGYWLAGLVGMTPTGGVLRFVIAVAGAALLIFVLNALGILPRA